MDERGAYIEWLKGLKKGDEVATPSSGSRNGITYQAPKVMRIDRITATQVIVGEKTRGERRYRLADGGMVGGSRFNDKIVPVTPKLKGEVVVAENSRRFSELSPKTLTDAQIAAMLEAYDRVNAEGGSAAE